jgi:hypothetical protein
VPRHASEAEEEMCPAVKGPRRPSTSSATSPPHISKITVYSMQADGQCMYICLCRQVKQREKKLISQPHTGVLIESCKRCRKNTPTLYVCDADVQVKDIKENQSKLVRSKSTFYFSSIYGTKLIFQFDPTEWDVCPLFSPLMPSNGLYGWKRGVALAPAELQLIFKKQANN